MRIIGCDLHTRQQTVAMLETETGEVEESTLLQERKQVREFYSKLPRPARVGIEARFQLNDHKKIPSKNGRECRSDKVKALRTLNNTSQK